MRPYVTQLLDDSGPPRGATRTKSPRLPPKTRVGLIFASTEDRLCLSAYERVAGSRMAGNRRTLTTEGIFTPRRVSSSPLKKFALGSLRGLGYGVGRR